MGRMSQYFDYLSRQPEDFYKEISAYKYTHISLTPDVKKLRKSLRWWLQIRIMKKKMRKKISQRDVMSEGWIWDSPDAPF